MRIDDLAGPRFQPALERFLQRKDVLAVDEISLELRNDESLLVRVSSSYAEPRRETAQRDVALAESLLERLIDQSPELKRILTGRPREYQVLANYGQGAMLVATAKEKRFQWQGA